MTPLEQAVRKIIAHQIFACDYYALSGADKAYTDQATAKICGLLKKEKHPLMILENGKLKQSEQEKERLKQGICEHVALDVIDGNCRLCDMAIAKKGYPIWVEKAKRYKKALEKILETYKDTTYDKCAAVIIAQNALKG